MYKENGKTFKTKGIKGEIMMKNTEVKQDFIQLYKDKNKIKKIIKNKKSTVTDIINEDLKNNKLIKLVNINKNIISFKMNTKFRLKTDIYKKQYFVNLFTSCFLKILNTDISEESLNKIFDIEISLFENNKIIYITI